MRPSSCSGAGVGPGPDKRRVFRSKDRDVEQRSALRNATGVSMDDDVEEVIRELAGGF